MSCACIKKREFDISVLHKGCEILVLEDQSTWVGDFGYDKPDTYDVLVTIPSRDVEVTLSLKTNAKNFITSKDLFGSDITKCLPDDIYCFSVVSCGYKLNINRAYLCTVELKLNELVAKYAETMTEDQRKTILDLTLQIQSIKLNAEQGNVEIAKRLFKKVKDKLKNYHCDNC